MSILYTDMTQVIGILPRERPGLAYFTYSALPNKHTIMLINFCKIGNAVLLLLGAVW